VALVVFTGGARSGKSTAAQSLVAMRALDGQSITVAVFGRETGDVEYASRIAAHRGSRPAEWRTVEVVETATWPGDLDSESVLLVDCLGTLLGLAMEEAYAETAKGALGDADATTLPVGLENAIRARFDRIVDWLLERDADTVVVTNEVGDGIVPSFASGRLFRDLLGRANRRLVDRAEASYLCVAGRLVALDCLSREARWPND